MNLFAFSGLLIGIACISMAGWVFLANRNSPVNKLWSIFCFFVAIWGFGCFAIGLADSPGKALLFWRLTYVSVILIPALFYNFVLVFLGLRHYTMLWILYAITLAFEVANATPLFMPAVARMFDQFYYVTPPGILYPFFVIFFIATIIVSHVYLWQFTRNSDKESKKTQVRWFFIASTVGYLGAATCFLPVFEIKIYPYGNFTVALYPVIMGYAIVRHRLMDIDVMIKRAAVFTGLFAFAYGIFSLFVVLGQRFFSDWLGWNQWIATIPTLTVIILAQRPLENFLTEKTNKFLFQKKFDYHRLIGELINELYTVLDQDKIIKKTESLIKNTIFPEGFRFYLLDPRLAKYVSKGEDRGEALDSSSPILQVAKTATKPIDIMNFHPAREFINSMKQIKMELLLPIRTRLASQNSGEEFYGFILMGKKKSDDDYTPDDLNVLETLSHTLALALANAKSNQKDAKDKADEEAAIMARGLSHQFKNSFYGVSINIESGMMSCDEVLQLDGNMPPDEKIALYRRQLEDDRTSMAEAFSACKRGSGVAKVILNFLGGNKHYDFQMANLGQCIHVGIDAARLKQRELKDLVKIEKQIEPNLPLTYCTEDGINEMLFNAIDNAFDSIHDMIKENKDYLGKIDVSVSHIKETNVIRFVIKDNGVGIKKSDMASVKEGVVGFTTKGTSHEKSGHGIGVAFIKLIIKLHGGRLDFESVYGYGASCIMEIPIIDKATDEMNEWNKQEIEKSKRKEEASNDDNSDT